jgi:hypothetical protein
MNRAADARKRRERFRLSRNSKVYAYGERICDVDVDGLGRVYAVWIESNVLKLARFVDGAWKDATTVAAGSGRVVRHTYAKKGTYAARLTIKDDRNGEAAKEASLNVLNLFPPFEYSMGNRRR